MDAKKMRDYITENFKEYFENACRSCHTKTKNRLVHKETGDEYPFCVKCINQGFYNKEIFEVKYHREVKE